MNFRRVASVLGLAALISALAACGSQDGSSLVEIDPASPNVEPGQTVQFFTRVAGTEEPATWSVAEPDGGTIDAAGNYTAPDTEGTYTLLASVDSLQMKAATQVYVKRNVRVALSPSSATIGAGESLAFVASVTGSDKSVTWSIAEAPEGGAVTAAGVYTAPQTAGTYQVVATSVADPSRSGSATITVTAQQAAPLPAPTVAIAVTPQTAAIETGSALQLAATVTGSSNAAVAWSVAESGGGTVTASGLYTAPTTAGTYHVVATSQADTSKTATSTMTVTAPPPLPPPPPPPPPSGVVPAFAGAQGAGALSKGGRGGKVYEVTNLSDSGTGSLRACIEASGARTCVFRVAGTIVLKNRINIYNPYLTVAGQTSPGGIQIRAAKTTAEGGPMNNALITVLTHDVTIRFLRLRHGKTDSIDANQQGHPIKINDGGYNVIIDHCSLMWTQDENLGIWAFSKPIYNTTLSWSIVAEPLAGHPTNFMLGAASSSLNPLMTDLDFHHNFVGTSNHRNPQMIVKRVRWINNVVYNYKRLASQLGGALQGDFIGNIYKLGPLSYTSAGSTVRQMIWRAESALPGNPSLMVTDNKGPSHPDPTYTSTEWTHMVGYTTLGANGVDEGPLNTAYRRTTPLAPVGVPITPEKSSTLEYSMGLTTTAPPVPVGASRRLDGNGRWVDAYDSTDRRVLQEYRTNTGPDVLPIDGTPPTIVAVAPYPDSDHDGMADAWESAQGLNPNDPSDGTRTGADGYTNLERFLNGQ